MVTPITGDCLGAWFHGDRSACCVPILLTGWRAQQIPWERDKAQRLWVKPRCL